MILLIATHELRRLFVSLTAWASLAMVSFFGAAFFYSLLHNWMNIPELRLRGGLTETVVADFLQLAGIMLLLLSPLLTMRLFSEERRNNTLQLVLSSPVSITQLVLGKFLGVAVFYLALLLLLALVPLCLLPVAALDQGQLAAALLGLLLMTAGFIAVGLFVSSLCASQTGAALGTFATLFLLWIAGLSKEGGGLFAWLSLLNHYNHFRAGTFHSADLAYYLLLCGGAIGLTIWRLDIERLHGRGADLLRANSIATLCLMLCLMSLVAWASARYNMWHDWTRHGRHSLSTASQGVLSRLPDRLLVTAYARSDLSLRDKTADFVARYQRHKKNLELHFVNPDVVPREVRKLNIRTDGELVLRYGGRVEHVRHLGEQNFSNALRRLTRDREHWLAFVEGHGERQVFGKAEPGFSKWARYLDDQGFKVQPLNLATTGTVPDNISVLILGNPQTDYLDGELAMLQDYVARGGNLLWLADPGELHGLQGLGEMLGIQFEAGVIVDPNQKHPARIPFHSQQYGPHAITQGLTATAVLPGSASILVRDDQKMWRPSPLLRTTMHAWNETGGRHKARYDEDSDNAGPLQAGISIRRAARRLPAQTEARPDASGQNPGPENGQRIVVIGDGDFLSNAHLGRGGNLELGMRIINWLAAEEQLLNVPTRMQPDRGVHLRPRVLQWGGLGFLLVLPTAFLLSGLAIRLRRRRRR